MDKRADRIAVLVAFWVLLVIVAILLREFIYPRP
jgi:hypothetical protein